MSTTQKLPTPVDGSSAEDTPAPAPSTRRQWLIRGTTAALIAAGCAGTALLYVHRTSPAIPTGAASMKAKDAPVALPTSVLGLSPLAGALDPTQQPAWRLKARQAGNGATVEGRTYGSGEQGARTVRVVVGRTDLTGQLDQSWAADQGQQVGNDRCTNNTIVVKNSQPRIRPTVMLCWRTTATLSGYALIIDPKSKTPVPAADAAQALDAAWQGAQ